MRGACGAQRAPAARAARTAQTRTYSALVVIANQPEREADTEDDGGGRYTDERMREHDHLIVRSHTRISDETQRRSKGCSPKDRVAPAEEPLMPASSQRDGERAGPVNPVAHHVRAALDVRVVITR